MVKHYEAKCVQSLLNNNKNESKINNEQITILVNEINTFLRKTEHYLEQLKINDEELKQFNLKSEDLQLKLKKEDKLNNLISGNTLIEFKSNLNVNQFELSYINYREPTVFYFSFYFLIIKSLFFKFYKFFCSCSDGSIKLIEIQTKQVIKTYEGHRGQVISVKQASD